MQRDKFWAMVTRADFVTQWHQLLWFTPQFKAISECRQKKFFQPEIQNKHCRNVAPKPVRQTLTWCGRREVFKRSYLLMTKEEGHQVRVCLTGSRTTLWLCCVSMFAGFQAQIMKISPYYDATLAACNRFRSNLNFLFH